MEEEEREAAKRAEEDRRKEISKKTRIFEKNPKNIEIYNFIEEKDKKYMGWRGTLRVLRAETWLTVYRTIAIRKQ